MQDTHTAPNGSDSGNRAGGRHAGTGLLRRASWTVVALAAGLALTLCAVSREPLSGEDAPPAPAFTAPRPARNPVTLALVADERKVVGWITGTKDFTGREITVRCGDGTQSIIVQEGNVFAWHYKVDKSTEARFSIDDLRQTVTLSPAAALEPSVFFVVDRTVYRPGHRLQFAAFLRRLDQAGAFAPVAGEPVKVLVTSERKKTTAAELALTSDDFGRIIGSYQFSEADALDNYRLSVPNYKGGASVTLAEFRKSKIRLRISGQLQEPSVRLTFEALDFMDRPVPGSKVRYVAQVIRRDDRAATHALNEEEFVYHPETPALLDPENLSEEETLLHEADPAFLPGAPGAGASVAGQVTGDLDMPSGKAEHVIPVKTEWLDGRHSLLVQGVLVDANGREQQATEKVPLFRDDRSLRLTLPRRYYEVGQTICVTAGQGAAKDSPLPATLVAMRLSPVVQAAYHVPAYGRFHPEMQSAAVVHTRSTRWYGYQPPTLIQRTMVTAVPFKDGKAELKLTEPGAYVLVGVAHHPDGATLRGEVGCVVEESDDLPGLILNLDKAEYATGEVMTADIHSRFANARVLLTLRDSTGIRLWRPVQLDGSSARVRLFLGSDLRYGCSVDVQYADAPGRVHLAERFVRVVPRDRIIQVQTHMKETVDAGETVRIAIEVNRNEPVDLVVSVYDESLLGIAPDRSADIRNFYLADDRVRAAKERQLLRRRLAGAVLGGIVEQAQKVLADNGTDADPQGRALLQNALAHYNSGVLYAGDVTALLNCAGVRTFYAGYPQNWYARIDKARSGQTTLFEVMDAPGQGGWQLAYAFSGQTLTLVETHPSHQGQPLAYWSRYAYYDYAPRADAARSVSLNASHSASGQSFISHLPEGPAAPEMLVPDGGTGSISIRRDFSDVAFWNAALRTDDRGRATAEFKLPDSLTHWQVVVTAVSRDMHVGRHKARFLSTKPIMVWPMLPRVFTEGDKVEIFGSVHNCTEQDQVVRVCCKVDNGEVLTSPAVDVVVKAGGNAPVYWTFRAGRQGFTQILMTAECDAGKDASLKRLPVVASGVEEAITASGFCKGTAALVIPAEVDLASARLEICLAPTLAADMVDTLDYLVDYPHGCVEQTMSRFLPAIKVAQILRKFHVENKALQEKLPQCVAMGIKRLLELQQADGGWGWNGSGQTHEMMTPYALYGLLEAERAGYRIGNEGAITRGLDRLKGFIDNMGENQAADRIYCMYVYAHRREIQPAWWTFISDQLAKKKLSDYATALALEMAVQKGRSDLAADLAGALRLSASKSGGAVLWRTAGFSRWGNDPNEVSAAALKALVAFDADDPLIPGVLAYFAQTKRGRQWNSTKDTAMIIYAMCDVLARQDADLRALKTVTMVLNEGSPTKVRLDEGAMKKVLVAAGDIRPGRNVLRFADASPGTMYRLILRYRKTGRDIPPQASGIEVARRFYLLNEKGQRTRPLNPGDAVPRGAYLESEVTARILAGGDMRYVLLENPKPSGCEVLPAEDIRYARNSTAYVLREDKTASVLYHHEQTGSAIQDRCVLHAELAGEYVVAPASVELMYQTGTRGHSGTFGFVVQDAPPTAVAAAR